MLRILFNALRTGVVTTNYPAEPNVPPERFRSQSFIAAARRRARRATGPCRARATRHSNFKFDAAVHVPSPASTVAGNLSLSCPPGVSDCHRSLDSTCTESEVRDSPGSHGYRAGPPGAIRVMSHIPSPTPSESAVRLYHWHWQTWNFDFKFGTVSHTETPSRRLGFMLLFGTIAAQVTRRRPAATRSFKFRGQLIAGP